MKKVFLSNIDASGLLQIIESVEFQTFLQSNKGKEAILTIETSQNRRFTLLEHYYNHIIPKCKDGFKSLGYYMNEAQTCRKLREVCGLYHCEESEHKSIKDVSQLSEMELFDFIDQIKLYGYQFLNVWIDDPVNHQ